MRLAADLRFTAPPQVEQARLRAELRLVEERIATAPAADDIRQRINKSLSHLETAISLWRQHMEERAAGVSDRWRTTRKRSRLYVRQSRRHWKGAMRMLAQTPQAA
jgi:hypothetical protein